MYPSTRDFYFLATGIGSVPYLDIENTCRNILEHLPQIPFWPQFVMRSPLEDMTVQFIEGLPLVRFHEETKALAVSTGTDREKELITFYDHFLAQDTEYFAISKDFAPGLHKLLELLGKATQEGKYVKGQTIGPITFCASLKGPDQKAVLHDEELLEAMVNGLSIKALWQAKQLTQTGRVPILFLDEPYLSGFGSAFSPIDREQVIDILKRFITYLKERIELLIGIHCCGNTDWAMLLETGPDIINFDAWEYMEHFLLYEKAITHFLYHGGHIAWGIVPTSRFTGSETSEDLVAKLQQGIRQVMAWGIDQEILFRQSLLTPACGMGTMTPEAATKAMELLGRLSEILRN
ncbi:MAG: methionine synthase [Deltaproteobacteria bacterium]|nr:methionine synthase [Deltaproteobacteria bacterium]MBW1929449.1 methionine synthase [Deltaproteobacteria bacterium]MBW2023892.1 methionine synthase [Deltaproteobacteria bacterium]MBW2124181.1 methionine synthase [Deltaproteobacteria bacterium]RLB24743.1 MAG: methionine synthase [Deltaproteobacteria bacterium]